ncbi:MAG: LacI family DNA-binding transcriptional regulator [Catonella sp.]|nr:LacI family DNA-binding transcriptional regulator [Catonella sp.]
MRNSFTSKQIAADLGVSQTTVSRALSGKGRVSPATRELVKKYIIEHGGTYEEPASDGSEALTTNIAIVIPEDYNQNFMSFFMTCLSGIQETCQANGYDLLVTSCGNKDVSSLVRIVEKHKVDGVILARTYDNDAAVEFLQSKHVPFVTIGTTPVSNVTMIDEDNVGSAMEMTQILIAKGFKKLALICGSLDFIVNRQRLEGFNLGVEEAGLPLHGEIVYTSKDTVADVSDCVSDILSKGADCIVCADDNLAMMTLNELRRRHVHIPGEVKIASFYDSTYLMQYHPSVTSLVFDSRTLGRKAAEKLLFILGTFDSDQSESISLSYEISFRESTK